MVADLILRISPSVVEAFAGQRADTTAARMIGLIGQSNPQLAGSMQHDEFCRRIEAGVAVSRRVEFSTDRDIMLLCLAHAVHGSDMLSRPEFAWLADLVAESRATPDTRAYRMHCRLADA